MGTVVRTGSRALVGVACLLLAFSATDTGPGVTQPEVDTPLGRVRGRQVGVKGTDHLVNVFLGIPFAQPPLGPHRFSAPRPAESWEGVRDASRAHAVCPQDPERMNNSRFTLDGKHQTFPISEDCLILNIYSPAEAPSGAGRPVLSPLAAGLFHRAIAQSGIITVPGLLDPNPWLLAQTLADSLACNSDSSAEMVQCLRQKTIKEMILAYKSKKIASYNIDGTFFPKSAEELLRERQFPSVPFLFGFNNHEFGWLIPRGWGFLDKMDQLSLEDMLAILRPSLTNMDVPTEVMPTIIKEYLGSSSDGQAKREALQELLSDIIITLPMLQFARDLQDSGVSIFFYEFQHRPSSFAKIKPAWVQADHAAELTFMFGGPFLTDESSMLAFPEATEEEKQLSLTMMAQWTNFAWTGDPNGKGLPLWPPFNHAEEYLEISLVPRVNQKPREARMQLWAEILPTKFGQWQQKQKGKKVQEEL
ncbi:carboxylesterase 3 isoform X3 [Bos indicus]|uniref:Carboxylesterase 3 isoform X3 n=1 Tax=Bos indicus TaxID=9915 RepID=A0ABM4QU43_BOSIN